jgi:hypothetical protein
MTANRHHVPHWGYFVAGAAIFALAAIIEYKMGRVPISKSGRILLWVGDTKSSENSQQLFDWYSFTHIIHGFALYGLLHLISRGKWPMALRLVMAIFLEASWEVIENSSLIIDRYRQSAISAGYFGDSILNSMSDIFCCAMGFVIAAWIPARLTVALILIIELGLAWAIRDNLTLNIIMLIHPFPAIKHWQLNVIVCPHVWNMT